MLRPPYRLRKRRRYPLNMRLGGPDSPGKDKYLTLLQQIKPQFLGRPVYSLVTVPSTFMLTGVKMHSRQNIAPTVLHIPSG